MSSHADGVTSPLQSLIDQAPIRAIQFLVLLLCTLVTLIEGVDLALIPLLANQIKTALSLEQKELGLVLSALPVGLMIGGLVMGYVGDRLGRRPSLIASMVLMTLATLATSYANSLPTLLACRVLTGFSFGGVIPAAMALMSEFMPAKVRTNVLAFVALGAACGQLAASIFMKLIFKSGPWQTPVVYVAAACGVVTLLLILMLPESPRFLLLTEAQGLRLSAMLKRLRIDQSPALEKGEKASGVATNQFADLFSSGRAFGTLMLWGTFIGVCAAVSFFSNSLTYLYTQAGKPNSLGVDAMAAYSAGAILGGLILPLFARRWHANRVLMAAIFLAGVVTASQGLVLPMTDNINLILAGLCGAFVSGAFFLLYPPAVRFYPTAIRSTGIGAAVAFGRIGNIITPLLGGIMLGAGYSPTNIFLTMALPLLISFTALIVFHRATTRFEIVANNA